MMTIKKEHLKERIDQRKKEVEDLKKVHDELLALRASHKEENIKFKEKKSALIFKDQIQSQAQTETTQSKSTPNQEN